MTATRDDMTWIPGATLRMGSDAHYIEEAPAHRVDVNGFWIDACPVTNAEFGAFVAATAHRTFAEIAPSASEYPNAPAEALVAGSLVFVAPANRAHGAGVFHHVDWRSWWRFVEGADWRHPRGRDSTIDGLDDHPVVHIAYDDAIAYARWCGKDLPTEAEFELAARSGLDDAEFAWGDDLAPNGRALANYWLGDFPHDNRSPHRASGTSPVRSYPANAYGAYDLIGNVWEWTADWYSTHAPVAGCCGARDGNADNHRHAGSNGSDVSNGKAANTGGTGVCRDPRGATRDASIDRDAVGLATPRKVLKGGSHLCAPGYCARYRPAARLAQPVDTTTCHVGFRCVVRERSNDAR